MTNIRTIVSPSRTLVSQSIRRTITVLDTPELNTLLEDGTLTAVGRGTVHVDRSGRPVGVIDPPSLTEITVALEDENVVINPRWSKVRMMEELEEALARGRATSPGEPPVDEGGGTRG